MNDLEAAFYKALRDLRPFLKQLILVGGWVPYVYQTCVWKNIIVTPQWTTDVDFGISKASRGSGQSVYHTLSKLKYPERHVRMDRLYPVIPQIQMKKRGPAIPLEFLCDRSLDMREATQLVGPQIHINALPYFDVVLSDTQTVPITTQKLSLKLRIPAEAIFIFHKLMTFQLRDTKDKAAKDLYYAYYMLRYSPNGGAVRTALRAYRSRPQWTMVRKGLRKFFGTVNSAGPWMVEHEFGPDSLIINLRQHILDTFRQVSTSERGE